MPAFSYDMAAHQSSLLDDAGASSEDDLAAATKNATRKPTKSKAAPQKAMAAKTATKRKAASKPRQPLKDRTNLQSDVEDVDDEDAVAKPKAKRAKTAPARKTRAKAAETLGVIPETQQDPVDIEQSIEIDPEDVEVTTEVVPPPAQRAAPRIRSTSAQPVQVLQPRPSARAASAQPVFPPPRTRERSGSVSGTEREQRGGDPESRRKLNDLTKKYDTLNLKYQNLQEIGKNNADTNFEKLKKASDEKAKDAAALIASLKKEIAELRKATTSNTSETTGLQKQITILTTANEKLTNEAATLKEKLQTSQNEVKGLEAKLVAARQQVSNGSTQETNGKASSQSALSRSVNANATDAQKEAKMKENLYSDLTGLIIRGVKRKDGEDQYDCIQTGRNGTLHFHLSVADDTGVNNPKTPSGLSYEEAEFAYEPFLEEPRDRDLLSILPDYLAEEICFPRNHAVKFYSKIVESMTKRIVVEDDEEGE
ncbi:hypothetical protein LTS10_002461 [Elasticomyces elasticus]|nr:hypothetical protein LTS10_002461 [Elasticomyces elasticus]